MNAVHGSLREALGAYTVGALDGAERAEMERHLRDCGACRDELASLAVLPGLLNRLSADEVAVADGPPPWVAPAEAPADGRARARQPRARWLWGAAAAAAVVALFVLLVPLPAGDDAVVFEPRPVVSEAAETRGRVAVAAEPWGMRVDLQVRDLPPRGGYGLWAVDADGHRALAASWSAPPGDAVRLDGSCYMSVDDLVRFEVHDVDDEVLLVFERGGAPVTPSSGGRP